MSKDCHFSNEVYRGNVGNGFHKQHQHCVRRRAEISTVLNPNCTGPEHAKELVDKAWDSCYNDLEPFGYVP